MAQPGQPSTTTTRAPQRRPFVYWPSQSPHASIGSASHSGFASAVSDSSRISQSRQGRIEHLHNADRRQSLCKLHQIPTVTGSAKSLLPSALRYAKLYHWRVTKNDRHTEKRCHPATTALLKTASHVPALEASSFTSHRRHILSPPLAVQNQVAEARNRLVP